MSAAPDSDLPASGTKNRRFFGRRFYLPPLTAQRTQSADKPLFWGLLVLLVWLPLPLGSNRPWAWAVMEVGLFALAGLWLILAALGRAAPTSASHKAWPALLLWCLWVGYLALQIAPLPLAWVEWLSPAAAQAYRDLLEIYPDSVRAFTLSLDPSATRSALLKSGAYGVLFCLVLLLLRSGDRIRTAVLVLVLSGVFQALFGSFMTLSGVEHLLFGPKESYLGFATGTFVNRNHLAGYLNMCLALGLGALVAGSHDVQFTHWKQRLRSLLSFLMSAKMRLRVYLAIMAIALVLTRSRMGNSAFFVSLLLTGLLWLAISRRRPQRAALVVLGSILAIDILIMGQWFGLDKLVRRLEYTSAATETRDEVVRDSIPYAQDFLLTGSGAGSFYSTYPGYMGEGVNHFYRYAHNDYLQFFVENGVVGSVLLAAMVLSTLYCSVLAMRRRRSHLRGLGYGAFMGILAILIHSSVDFNLQIPANAALFVSLMAMAWVAYGCDSGRTLVSRENVMGPEINRSDSGRKGVER